MQRLACVLTLFVACSSPPSGGATDGAVSEADAQVVVPPDAAPPPDTPPPPEADAATARVVSCSDEPPPGSAVPPPLPAYSGGACPPIAIGRNTLPSGGADRQFVLLAPADYDPATERLPVLFMWHYLGGDADSLEVNGQIQAATNSMRFLAVLPEKKGDLPIPFSDKDWCWPYLNTHSDARVQEEVTFFDDMLACVAAQLPVNESCISSLGVSAGALWTAQLGQLRAARLSSILVISGGVGPASPVSFVDARGWSGAARSMPALVVWGGATDECVLDFDAASRNLVSALDGAGHFVEECIHNCGHAVPPIDDPTAGLAILYRFALDHPYWLYPGESPYSVAGTPAGTPAWCGLGPGGATERSGECLETSADSGCPTGL